MWMNECDTHSDVVLSSRVRLARNVKDVVFPALMDNAQKERMCDAVRDALAGSAYSLIRMSDLSKLDQMMLVERHLISPDLVCNPYGAVLCSKDEQAAVMVNEEDHLRIQAFAPSLHLKDAEQKASEIHRELEKKLGFAFDDTLGFLTACPTNTGTGMRVSVMLHLPALTISRNIQSIVHATGQFGLTMRGIYGEGTAAQGCIYQLSNQITLGLMEEEIVSNIENAARRLIEQERKVRADLFANRVIMEDRAYRAYGTMLYARRISIEEFMKLFSDVKLGVSAGVIKGVNQAALHTLLVELQPAGIQKCMGDAKNMDIDEIRAQLLREKLKDKEVK
ncbi:MAG: protein arginine kinase [Christensenellales bacterium]|jgi:protein arginine kinase